MTTLIKHYVREQTKHSGIKHWDAIFDDGVLKTEKQVHTFNDGVDSDLLWFTTADTVAGGASNYLTQTMATCSNVTRMFSSLTRTQFNNKLADYMAGEEEYLCFVFDADEIGAELWSAHKKRWQGASIKRAKYIKKIDGNSNINGDDTRDYWITECAVDITQAVDFYFVKDSRMERLQRFGFEDCYDFSKWYNTAVRKAYTMGMRTDEKINTFLGKQMLKRDNYDTFVEAA